MKSASRGVALITVLLVVALAATVCAALVTRQQLSIRTTANQLHARQAWHYARGGEQLALAFLSCEGVLDRVLGEARKLVGGNVGINRHLASRFR